MVLLPWGWTTAKPGNYDDIYNLAMEAASALQSVYGTRYYCNVQHCHSHLMMITAMMLAASPVYSILQVGDPLTGL